MFRHLISTSIIVTLGIFSMSCQDAEFASKSSDTKKEEPKLGASGDENGQDGMDALGRKIDSEGRWIDDDGNYVDAQGNRVDKDGDLIDDDLSKILDENGNPIKGDGIVEHLEELMKRAQGDGSGLEGSADSSDMGAGETGDGSNNPTGKSESETKGNITGSAVASNCMTAKDAGELKTNSTVLSIRANSSRTCDWKRYQSDVNNVAAGMLEFKDENFKIDPSHTICSIDFSANNDFVYDDYLAFTLNNKLLFWAHLNVNDLEKTGDFYNFDFAKLYDQGDGKRSEGCYPGADTCNVPRTEMREKLNVSYKYDQTAKYEIAAEIAKNGSDFALVILGDNDKNKDCRHSGIDIQITYEYMIKK